MANRVRGFLQSVLLNPATTSVIDRVFPAKSLGARGEREAERYLLRKGYIIVHRGFANQFSEVDLIAIEGQTVVFVEVKTRSSDVAGRPDEAVDDEKQQRLTRAALAFLRKNNLLEHSSRFDVVAITWASKSHSPSIQHFENAFEAQGDFQMHS